MDRVTLGRVPIKDLFMCNNFDLSPYGLAGWRCSATEPGRLVVLASSIPCRAIQVEAPFRAVKHPEKMEATAFGLFCVTEYTRREAYTTEEVDWVGFLARFMDACEVLSRAI